MKHTPTPWEFEDSNGTCSIYSDHHPCKWEDKWGREQSTAKQVIANTNKFFASENGATEDKDTSRANAQRIVACVNAFDGIPDPEAFMAVVKQLRLDDYDKLEAKYNENLHLLDQMRIRMAQDEHVQSLKDSTFNQLLSLTSEILQSMKPSCHFDEKVVENYRGRMNMILGISAGGGR